MGKLEIFSNDDFGEIRVVEIQGEPWFVGKDVAKVLGYAETANMRQLLDDTDDKEIDPQNGLFTRFVQNGVTLEPNKNIRRMLLINESGLYQAIFGSKLPTAKAFKRWVTSEVLPSIRKNGGYINGQSEMSPEELMARALQVAQKTLEEREARINALAAQNSELIAEKELLQPKADYFDELVDRNLLTNFRETAKELGIGQREFVNFLIDNKYIYRDKRGKLMPYTDKNNGLFEVKESFNKSTQWSGTQTLITPLGREKFRLLCIEA